MEPKFDVRTLNAVLPYLFDGEIEYLEELAKSIPDYSSCVILGAGPGLCSLALKGSNSSLRIIAIDYNESVVRSYQSHLAAAGFSTSVYIGRTIDPLPLEHSYPDYMPVKLLIVDADHSEKSVVEDITMWWPELSKGSIIFIHDYIDTELNGSNGTKQAIEYLCTKGCMKDSVELIAEPGISRVYKRIK